MTARRTRTAPDERQSSLFGESLYTVPSPPPALPGSLSCSPLVCGLVSYALDHARQGEGLSRTMVAARMAELTGERITESMLNAMTAESHEGHRFPLQWLPALIAATGCHEVLTSVADKVGALVLIGQAAVDAKLGQIERQMERLKAEKAKLKRGVRRHA